MNLVVMGKQGWGAEEVAERLHSHAECGKRLVWFDGISDECMERVCAASTCLIAASEGEDLGLPLIEAAKHKLPIIARDIPLFRELAGEHAYYFSGLGGQDLATAIDDWLQLHGEGRQPKSDAMPWLTWKESAEQLKRALCFSPAPARDA
ncbi:glycosyltransferase [Azotobacter sp. CWF10]